MVGLLLLGAFAGCGGGGGGGTVDGGPRDARADRSSGDASRPDAARDAAPDGTTDGARPDATSDGSTLDAEAGTPEAGMTDGGPGTCTTTGDCPAGEYCAGTSCEGPGRCAERPAVCTREWMPVCGCDGRTYSNRCTAASAGVRVASEGECTGGDCPHTARGTCCFDDADCSEGTVCRGARCIEGGEGTCVVPPGRGQCWADTDCPRGLRCVGHSRCPCGAMCLVPDRPGTCQAAP